MTCILSYERARTIKVTVSRMNEVAIPPRCTEKRDNERRADRESIFKTKQANKNKWFDVALTSFSNFE